MNNNSPCHTLKPIFLKLPRENIAFLKFVLETYEGLGELRTLDGERGEVVILAPKDTVKDIKTMLNNLLPQTRHREIVAPDSIINDWLLNP